MRLVLLCALLFACDRPAPPKAEAADGVSRVVEHEGVAWRVFDLDLRRVKLALLGQAEGEPRTFKALDLKGERLVMATNAGIFQDDRTPNGLHVERGQELHALERADGEGNFYLKPNGVFWVDARGAHVAASERYAPEGEVVLATQSGPLLLDRGKVHPKFTSPGTSRKVRSAVGVDARGHVLVAFSREPVSFIDSATLFQRLKCKDALYLDGEISGVLTPEGIEGFQHHEYGGLLVATER
ncbi:MAG: phosphodiester glycosidase family protein [Polyangiales bacterium]